MILPKTVAQWANTAPGSLYRLPRGGEDIWWLDTTSHEGACGYI